MFYLTGSVTGVKHHLDAGRIGFLKSPTTGDAIRSGWVWAADNGCFGKNYIGDERWMRWLSGFSDDEKERCLFATAPDVVGDAAATLARSIPWLPEIRKAGYKAAFVAQDGLTIDTTPWDLIDVLFIGGTTAWKLSESAYSLIREAKARRKFVHVGRVNSQKRLSAMAYIGADSADGTFIAFGPELNGPKVIGWVDWIDNNPSMF